MAGVQQRMLTRDQAGVVHEKLRRRTALYERRELLLKELKTINDELRTLRYKKLGVMFGVSERTIEAIAQGIHYAEVK